MKRPFQQLLNFQILHSLNPAIYDFTNLCHQSFRAHIRREERGLRKAIVQVLQNRHTLGHQKTVVSQGRHMSHGIDFAEFRFVLAAALFDEMYGNVLKWEPLPMECDPDAKRSTTAEIRIEFKHGTLRRTALFDCGNVAKIPRLSSKLGHEIRQLKIRSQPRRRTYRRFERQSKSDSRGPHRTILA